MIRRPPRSTLDRSSAASDVYKRQWRQQRCGLNGKTSRPPCGIEGNHHEGDRFRTISRPGQSTGRDQDCDQNSHRANVPILQRYAVTSAAFLVPCPKASSGFGVGEAAVGQSNAIANGFDLLSPIAFAHIFHLDCGLVDTASVFAYLLPKKVSSMA